MKYELNHRRALKTKLVSTTRFIIVVIQYYCTSRGARMVPVFPPRRGVSTVLYPVVVGPTVIRIQWEADYVQCTEILQYGGKRGIIVEKATTTTTATIRTLAMCQGIGDVEFAPSCKSCRNSVPQSTRTMLHAGTDENTSTILPLLPVESIYLRNPA